ncbi:hypothetical protein QE152_g37178 [Popillia japonica]|uniref:Retroviral polymerase SH3-like domain-containing protein n=1 Tax=Popillia japonica TaxID=7064 RepID=A0AAW1IBD6_POPJA
MLIDSNLPKEYWAEAMATAVYLKNRSPTKNVKKITPEECWTGKKTKCKTMVHILKQKRLKLPPKSEKLVFVGYCDNTKRYRLIYAVTKTITISRDVHFLENITQLNRHEVVEEENETHEMIIFENKEDVNQADNTDYEEEEVNPTEENKELKRSSRVPKPKLMEDYVTYYVGSYPQEPNEYLNKYQFQLN